MRIRIFLDKIWKRVDIHALNAYNDKQKGGGVMKRRDLVRKLEQNGWRYLRPGGNHDIYTNGIRTEEIGRHIEIDEDLAKKILKRNGI